MPDTYKVSLCEDCIVTESYGAPWGEVDAEPLTKVKDMLLGSDPDCRDGECEGHFDRECDGCNTQWAGNRYCYVAVPKATPAGI